MGSPNTADILPLISDLCDFATGVVSDENERYFKRLSKELPFTFRKYPSDSEHNGWVVPKLWRVNKSIISREGKTVFDGRSHTLGVAAYSRSFKGDMALSDLKAHLVTNSELPDAYPYHCMWQYRPWDADWAICMPHAIYSQLSPGNYSIELDTSYEPGEMIVAVYDRPGHSNATIVFNAHTCHPHMANDGNAGVAILVRLFQWLDTIDTFYNYRLVLGPEHLGTVFYLHNLPKEDVNKMVCGVFVEMPGTMGALKATSTFPGKQMIDSAFANALSHHSRNAVTVPWRKGAGNDETVWEAPGYEVPFVEFTRCEDQWAPYREYHSSMDTPELMDPGQLDEMFAVLKKVVEILEHNVTVQRKFDGLVCLSNPRYNLYMERPDPAVTKDLEEDSERWGHLLDCLFRYMEGDMTVLDIAQRHHLPFDRLRRYVGRFQDKGLVTLRRAGIPRDTPKRFQP